MSRRGAGGMAASREIHAAALAVLEDFSLLMQDVALRIK